MSESSTGKILFLSIVVSLGGFLFGYDAAVISGVVGFIVSEFQLNAWQTGFVVAAPSMTAIAAISAGPISDHFGRKKILLIISFLYIVSAAASAWAPNYWSLVVARAIGGLAFASLALAPIYITEIAPAHLRGRLVSINQLNIVIGFSAAYFSNDLFQKATGWDVAWVVNLGIQENAWRWMLGAELIPATLYFCLLFLLPESPRWLVMKDRCEDAKQVLARIMPTEKVSAQIAEIKATIEDASETFIQRFRQTLKPKLRFALTVGIIIGIAQQVSGINAIYFYAPTIFEQSGVGRDAAFTQAVMIGITNVVFTLLAIAMVDKLGRKPLLVGGLLGVFISMSICAYGFSKATYQLDFADLAQMDAIHQEQLQPLAGQQFDSDVAFKQSIQSVLSREDYLKLESQLLEAGTEMNAPLILFGILGFVASFAISLGPVMWVMLPEIFPNCLRGVGMAVVGLFNTSVSYVVQLVFPWELETFGAAMTFFIYGVLALVNMIIVLMVFPETRGKSVEDLERILCRESPKKASSSAASMAGGNLTNGE